MLNQFLTKVQKQFNGGKIAFSKHGAGKLYIRMFKQKLNLNLSHSLPQNYLKICHGLKSKMCKYKIFRKKCKRKPSGYRVLQSVLGFESNSTIHKRKT